jgi:hypothetical protein
MIYWVEVMFPPPLDQKWVAGTSRFSHQARAHDAARDFRNRCAEFDLIIKTQVNGEKGDILALNRP